MKHLARLDDDLLDQFHPIRTADEEQRHIARMAGLLDDRTVAVKRDRPVTLNAAARTAASTTGVRK